MSLEVLTDPRVRSVKWQDLVAQSKIEIVSELFIWVPWTLMSWYFAHIELYPLALFCSFMLFLTGLRLVHNAYHYAVGLSRTGTEWVIWSMSALMLFSMHAVQFNHLRHHRHCMNDEDVEAMSARVPWWKAIGMGPYFPFMMHVTAWKLGSPRIRRWMLFELLTTVALLYFGFFVLDIHFLKYHLLVMVTGQCFTAFFAVWTVHHGCDRSHWIARTLRNKFKNFISYNMFYHMEHHLYPMVPTCHLPELAKRLDVAAPELADKKVF